MKIKVSFAELDEVLRKMDVNKLAEGPAGSKWKEIDIELAGRGIDLANPSEITVEEDGTLSHEGRRILVYIRDQYISYGSYKFHVANCSTIQEMKESGRFKTRYVASTRTDGKFAVNHIGNDHEEGLLIEMRVCINCLKRLNYKGYNDKRHRDAKKVNDEFSLREFFEIYGRTTVSHPGNTNITTPVNAYSDHHPTFSRICRERAGWRCEECDILLEGEASKFLHAHHINGDKSNNSWDNLRSLCVECHNKQPYHSLPEPTLQEFQEYKRRRGLIK